METRGVQVGDVLGVITWADTPDKLTYSYYEQRLLTFTNGDYILSSIYAETPDVEPPYSMLVELYGSSSAEFAYENDATPTSWNSPTYDFGGRTVASIDDSSIQNVIKVPVSEPEPATIADKLIAINDCKQAIKDAIEDKGVTVGDAPFADYAGKIEDIPTGTDISDANAVAGDVVASKTFYATSGGKKTGTMTDRGTVSTDITTKAQQVTIAAGKHSGSGVVKISATEQAKIIAGNIKSGVTILGQAGSLTPAKEEETKTVTAPSFASGNIVVNPTAGKVMTQVTINKDTTNHVAGNIKDGVTLYGVEGTYEGSAGVTFPTSLTYTVTRYQSGMDMSGDIKFFVVDRYGVLSETTTYSLSGSTNFNVVISEANGIAYVIMALISDNCETLSLQASGNYPANEIENWSYPSSSSDYLYLVHSIERTSVISIVLYSMS